MKNNEFFFGRIFMNIIVCVKQVPGTNQVEVDPVTGVLKRDGVAGKLNPYDLFALEAALRIKDERGARITALSMGPNQAIPSLYETIYMGADNGVLLSDRKFAGADVQATSYALSCGVKKIGDYDLIICGKQTTDGDTAQVGPEMAEKLGFEHATNVVSIDEVTDEYITVTFSLDDCFQTQKMRLPCLITIDKDAFTPRLPSYKVKKTLTDDRVTFYGFADFDDRDEKVVVYSVADLDGVDETKLGLKGSPTQVERIFPPDKNKEKQVFTEKDDDLARDLFALLDEKKFI